MNTIINFCIKPAAMLALLVMLSACDQFLSEKSAAELSTPETFVDLRALMDNESRMNHFYPSLAEAGSDDYYVKSNILKARKESEQFVYTWTKDLEAFDEPSWNNPYSAILVANIVLEGLDRIVDGNVFERDALRGEALFVRSYALFYLAQVFCLPYNDERKGQLLGLPLRTSSDFMVSYSRSSMEATYDFIVNGIKESIPLLPESVQYKTRPTKSAAWGALAKIYLIMGKYEEANTCAKQALSYYDELLDYNSLDKEQNFPLQMGHAETIYYALCNVGYLLANNRAFIPREIFDSYEANDLRKVVFFRESATGDIQFKGNYDGQGAMYFAGVATDELYLIRSECEIRAGKISDGLAILNHLLKFRYETGTFIEYTDLTDKQALDRVLLERRKQLIKRGVRWMDLRRLNTETGRLGVIYRKTDNGVDNDVYQIKPEALNYAYPIPPAALRHGGYEQNAIN